MTKCKCKCKYGLGRPGGSWSVDPVFTADLQLCASNWLGCSVTSRDEDNNNNKKMNSMYPKTNVGLQHNMLLQAV